MRTTRDIKYCMTDGIPNEIIIRRKDNVNNKLKKEGPKRQADYQKKYMEKHQTLCIHLNKKEDSGIIRWLNKQENKSKAVRAALREAIVWTESHKTDV